MTMEHLLALCREAPREAEPVCLDRELELGGARLTEVLIVGDERYWMLERGFRCYVLQRSTGRLFHVPRLLHLQLKAVIDVCQ